MSSQIKISADTSEVKKSILDLSRSLKGISSNNKIAIFTAEDKKFLKTEMKKELGLMKDRLKANREEIKKLVDEQKKLTAGSKEELEIRKEILKSYQTQSRLTKDANQIKGNMGGMGGGGEGVLQGLSGGGSGIMGMVLKTVGMGALATAAAGVAKTIAATNQYVGGTPNRIRLKGLGVQDDNFGSAQDLARAGLSEQDMIGRRINATAVLGREGSSNDAEMQKAQFERAYGLQGGTMTNIAASLRAGFGGAGANEAQSKLQASVLASGIEDALGPYLDTMTNLLSSINENGTTNTGEVTNLMAQLTKDGGRTPEQMGKTFGNLNNAISGSSGEANAFLQTAFARAGIGGGTIGGTQMAISGGGLFGLDPGSLAKRGYNPELLKNMGGAGMFSGIGDRSNAMMSMFKSSGGLKPGQNISDITDVNQMTGMGNMANSVFGTKGNQGFDALMLLEKVQNKQMSGKDFDKKVKEMQETKDPQAERLDKINSSLAGQTEILSNIDANLSEALGKQAVSVRNAAKQMENEGTIGATNVAGALNQSGVVQAGGNAAAKAAHYMVGGGLGDTLYNGLSKASNTMFGDDDDQDQMDAAQARVKALRQQYSNVNSGNDTPTAKDIGKEVANALKNAPLSANVNADVSIKNSSFGSSTNERTHK